MMISLRLGYTAPDGLTPRLTGEGLGHTRIVRVRPDAEYLVGRRPFNFWLGVS